ncbi:MAG: hypothetical protein KBT27_01625 [Prevotellaceae bacterium]|nr:hypothetical protein [Candidatus Faecinaster equi]
MGSTGSGTLSDYTRFRGAVKGVTGGEDLVNKCDRAVATVLEDVETCDYYKKNGHVPAKGTSVIIILKTRLVAVDENGDVIGHLPTEYNYLLECLNDGYQYEGEVSGSFDTPVPSVYIAVTPQKL